jgi:hypothetical protein
MVTKRMRGWFQRCGTRVEANWSQRRIAACSVHGWEMVFEVLRASNTANTVFMAQEDHDTIPIKKLMIKSLASRNCYFRV